MSKILVVGMAVVDFLFEVDAMPEKAQKYVARDAVIVGGGGAANAACAITSLGGQALLAARIGDDMIGKLIIDDLQRQSVDCSMVTKTDNARSSFSSVLVDASGERQIVNFRGSDLSDDTRGIEQVSAQAVLADSRWVEGTVAAMQLARSCNIPAVLDAEEPLVPEVMKLASHIAFSRQGLESLTGALPNNASIAAALRDVAVSYGGWLAMTDGGNGVYSLHEDVFYHQPATAVEVVDTLGAGDVWHGAFTYWLACGYDEQSAVKFANAAATLKCTRAGGGRCCPDISEVTSFMQSCGE